MAEKSAEQIESRNKKYLEELSGNIGEYFSYLSTMARFHKYEVADLTSFAIEAPAMFTAVASKELWEKHFKRKINVNAKGVTLIKDGKVTVYYDVSETESATPNSIEVKLWKYEDQAHKKFLDAVVSGENTTENKIIIISEELAKRNNIEENSKKFLALNVEAVILERMGFSTESVTRQLARMSFKDYDIPKILEETQTTAKIFLDAMQRSVLTKSAENVSLPENNPLLKEIGVIQIAAEPEKKSKSKKESKPIQLSLFDDISTPTDDPKEKSEESESTSSEEIFQDEKSVINEVTTELEKSVEESVIHTPAHVDEILPASENVEENLDVDEKISVEENVPDEPIKTDLKTILAEDMAMIRGSSREKNIFRKNVMAIRTLHDIENGQRVATPEEIEVLKGFAGFGGIPKAFDKTDPNWSREAWLLQSMLTEKEYRAARASTLNAHYTSAEIIQEIYSGLENLGFQKGIILEPSMGVGGFFGNMPEEMKNGSHLYGVELDSLTGRIAKTIYPDAEINVQGFEDTRYLNNSFDIAVGNVPFGNYRVNDKGYNQHSFLIHDYFIAKMIDQVRTGGIVAVITSRGTLDKQDKSARKYFAQRADLVRAIRLPNTAFKEAGTEVTSDILFFRKLEKIRDEEDLPSWVYVNSFQGERDITINRYFIEHPEDVLGNLEKTSTAYGFDLTCSPDEQRPYQKLLKESMKSMPKIYSPSLAEVPLPQQMPDIEERRPLSFFAEDGEIKFFDGLKSEVIKINSGDRARMLLAMDMRDSVRNVIDIQVEDGDDSELAKAQVELNNIYDKYVGFYGHICEDATLKKIFGNDSAYPLLRSLEEYGKEGYKGKSPIFSKRMMEAHRKPTYAENPADALAISMQEVGRVDLDYMRALTGQTAEEIIGALEFERIYFDFKEQEYQIAEEYLSGDIRDKMEYAEMRIAHTESEINKKLSMTVLQIEEIPTYVPQNEIERKILGCPIENDPYFSFSRYYDEERNCFYDDYIETQKENRDFLLQVARRHGVSINRDKVSEILADKPLIALDAIRLGRNIGYTKPADLLILSHLRRMGEDFGREDEEHDLMLYDFLKKRLAKYEGDIQAIEKEVDNYYQRTGENTINEDWEKYKEEYRQKKLLEQDKINPELEYLQQIY